MLYKKVKYFILAIWIILMNVEAASHRLRVDSIDFVKSLDTSSIRFVPDFVLAHNIIGTLLLLGHDDRYYSYLAETWSIDHSNNSITFHLNPKAKFSNGDSITARDVANTFKRLLIKGATHLSLGKLLHKNCNLTSLKQGCSSIAVINDHTIRFYFKKFSQVSLFIFTLPDGGILHHSQYDGKLDITNWSITSGAYFCSKWDNINKKLDLKSNKTCPLYAANQPQYVEIFQDLSEDTIVNNMNRGITDFTFLRHLANSSSYKIVNSSKEIKVISNRVNGFDFISLNSSIAPFSNKQNRQMVYRYFVENNLDFRPIKDDAYFKYSSQFFSSTSQGYIGEREYKKLISTFPTYHILAKEKRDILDVSRYVSKVTLLAVYDIFQKFGIQINAIRSKSKDQISQLVKNAPFTLGSLISNEKEFQQTIDYILKHKEFYLADNVHEIESINDELLKNPSAAQKNKLIKQFNLSFINDAKIIPLYHLVSINLINNKYDLLHVNKYTTTPKIWNIRPHK